MAPSSFADRVILSADRGDSGLQSAPERAGLPQQIGRNHGVGSKQLLPDALFNARDFCGQ